MPTRKDWFEDWFDTPWYNMLYRHRDEKEAARFLDGLLEILKPSPGARFLDLACGNGRHAMWLNRRGFYVTGVDLSEAQIKRASVHSASNLNFKRHDMRHSLDVEAFDYVVNLFTSFGYFESDDDHLRTLESIYGCLKPGGVLVIDYLNANLVRTSLPTEETKNVDGTAFHISRAIEKGQVVKRIAIPEHGLEYEEKVRLFGLPEFQKMLAETGFELQTFYGDYGFNPFKAPTSDRLIILALRRRDV